MCTWLLKVAAWRHGHLSEPTNPSRSGAFMNTGGWYVAGGTHIEKKVCRSAQFLSWVNAWEVTYHRVIIKFPFILVVTRVANIVPRMWGATFMSNNRSQGVFRMPQIGGWFRRRPILTCARVSMNSPLDVSDRIGSDAVYSTFFRSVDCRILRIDARYL